MCSLVTALLEKPVLATTSVLRASAQPAAVCCEATRKNLGLQMAEISLIEWFHAVSAVSGWYGTRGSMCQLEIRAPRFQQNPPQNDLSSKCKCFHKSCEKHVFLNQQTMPKLGHVRYTLAQSSIGTRQYLMVRLQIRSLPAVCWGSCRLWTSPLQPPQKEWLSLDNWLSLAELAAWLVIKS